eukprot:3521129-Karenia_brevis.AAC.1
MWNILNSFKTAAPLAASTNRLVKCSKRGTSDENRAWGAYKNAEAVLMSHFSTHKPNVCKTRKKLWLDRTMVAEWRPSENKLVWMVDKIHQVTGSEEVTLAQIEQ